MMSSHSDFKISRRNFSRGLLGALAMPSVVPAMGDTPAHASATDAGDASALFAELDQKIQLGMAEYVIPGVAVAVLYKGHEFVKGYGVTDIRYPDAQHAVDANTSFLLASISKPFAGTAAALLADSGKLDLDAPITRYIDGFVGPAGSEGVTVRQLLNHTAGWLGDDFHDTGAGDDAIATYVNGIQLLPQLTPPGQLFTYSNSALIVSGRVIETVTGSTYDAAVKSLILDPLGMTRSSYFPTRLGPNLATPHAVKNGQAVAKPEDLYVPRNEGPSGGIFGSAADLLTFARFHLGDGRTANRKRLMSQAGLRSMWSQPGPGGTLGTELKGMGVSWATRPTIEGVTIVQHTGDWPGSHPALMMVPEQQFAIALLNNSDGGSQLRADLLFSDWVLQRFGNLHNLPATPVVLSASELAQYEGTYTASAIDFHDKQLVTDVHLVAANGALALSGPPGLNSTLEFYSYDRVIGSDLTRSDFLRAADGRIIWFRLGGRLYKPVV